MPLFTRENASEMARRGNLARWSRPPAPREPPRQLATTDPLAADSYREQRIQITRQHIELLDQKLAECESPKDYKAIADAIYRLQEVEAKLSGRPNPGTLKPSSAKQPKSNSLAFPQPIGPADEGQ